MSWEAFIDKIKPDGKAFRGIKYTKILFEVMAFVFKIAVDYLDFIINDQVWYVNDNFDPAPWEARYGIVPPTLATLEERRIVVKSYMLYPQSSNRLSLDYIQSEIDNAGFGTVIAEYNPSGDSEGYLHANDSVNEKLIFNVGALNYNSFILSGSISGVYFEEVIKLVMSIKPPQVAIYNKIEVHMAIALDDTLAWAIDDTLATALTKI
jgi:hypothetical protein